MERKIIQTSDGSRSLYLPQYDETYHSRHGAVQEAYHVFIRSGLDLFQDAGQVRILEIGFGTGLNCFITWLEKEHRDLKVFYKGVEAYPVEFETARLMEYPKALGHTDKQDVFEKLHASPWGKEVQIDKDFDLIKEKKMFAEIDDVAGFDLIYFDAFGPRVQPELWTEEMFAGMYRALDTNGKLVTYSAKGSVRRALLAVGFQVERLPGPPGKREMLRATKGGETL